MSVTLNFHSTLSYASKKEQVRITVVTPNELCSDLWNAIIFCPQFSWLTCTKVTKDIPNRHLCCQWILNNTNSDLTTTLIHPCRLGFHKNKRWSLMPLAEMSLNIILKNYPNPIMWMWKLRKRNSVAETHVVSKATTDLIIFFFSSSIQNNFEANHLKLLPRMYVGTIGVILVGLKCIFSSIAPRNSQKKRLGVF